MRIYKSAKGASTAETVLLAPFYFFLVFGVLQLGQLAVAWVIVNYAAGSIARQAVATNGSNDAAYTEKLRSLLSVGMKNPVTRVEQEGDGLLRNITVSACAEVSAYPFVGVFLGEVLARTMGSQSSQNCGGLHKFEFDKSRGMFVLQGNSRGRMNLKPS